MWDFLDWSNTQGQPSCWITGGGFYLEGDGILQIFFDKHGCYTGKNTSPAFSVAMMREPDKWSTAQQTYNRNRSLNLCWWCWWWEWGRWWWSFCPSILCHFSGDFSRHFYQRPGNVFIYFHWNYVNIGMNIKTCAISALYGDWMKPPRLNCNSFCLLTTKKKKKNIQSSLTL